jgi:hypothetical protein
MMVGTTSMLMMTGEGWRGRRRNGRAHGVVVSAMTTAKAPRSAAAASVGAAVVVITVATTTAAATAHMNDLRPAIVMVSPTKTTT